jgi:hypothetical protein
MSSNGIIASPRTMPFGNIRRQHLSAAFRFRCAQHRIASAVERAG